MDIRYGANKAQSQSKKNSMNKNKVSSKERDDKTFLLFSRLLRNCEIDINGRGKMSNVIEISIFHVAFKTLSSIETCEQHKARSEEA
jgi:hypothetical protein